MKKKIELNSDFCTGVSYEDNWWQPVSMKPVAASFTRQALQEYREENPEQQQPQATLYGDPQTRKFGYRLSQAQDEQELPEGAKFIATIRL